MHGFPQHLLDGYKSFMTGRYADERERYHELAAKGQSPETMIIACCDSRAAPETVFDCGPGELFVLRNIANLVPPFEEGGGQHGTSAGIEFAVQVLGVRNIVIMGHGRCGGIHAALNPAAKPVVPGNFIGKWLSLLDPAVAAFDRKGLSPVDQETAFERLSVANSIRNLRTFPYVAEREAAGDLRLHGAWFDIKLGELWIMDPETGEFDRPGA